MDDAQRYMLDVHGYLIVPQALSGQELSKARVAADRYIDGVFHGKPLPSGFYQGRKGVPQPGHSNLQHAFAFDPALEALCFHQKIWPIVLELTAGKPQLNGPGTMIVDDAVHTPTKGGPGLHCAREAYGTSKANVTVEFSADGEDKLRCNNFVVFPYLDDVKPGDGGLVVLPGLPHAAAAAAAAAAAVYSAAIISTRHTAHRESQGFVWAAGAIVSVGWPPSPTAGWFDSRGSACWLFRRYAW